MTNFLNLLSNLSSLGDWDFSNSSTRITRSLTKVFEFLESSSKTQEVKPHLILQTIENQLQAKATETNNKKAIETELSELFRPVISYNFVSNNLINHSKKQDSHDSLPGEIASKVDALNSVVDSDPFKQQKNQDLSHYFDIPIQETVFNLFKGDLNLSFDSQSLISNGLITPQTTASNLAINLPEFQKNSIFSGLTGKGYSVVILDTGIDLNHPYFGPDLDKNGIADRIVDQYDFSGNNDNNASDANNHGSNVSGIIASQDSTYPGITPEVNIIALKVFTDSGSGSFIDIEEALKWVVNNAQQYNVVAVNMSLGDSSNYTSPQVSLISDELAALAAQNVIAVSAAGNSGKIGVTYPAADPNSLAVSAVNNDGTIASFSQRDPSLTDVFAPGVNITSANKSGGTVTLSGTSQATPNVTGAIVLAQQLAEQKLGRRLTLSEIRGLLKQGGDVKNAPQYEGKLLDLVELGEGILDLAPADPSTHLTVNVNGSSLLSRVRSYGGSSQDVNAQITITDNSNILTISGNGWKRIPLNYTITANTVLEFDFLSTQKGEFHGIGFETNNSPNSSTHFKLYGTDTWAGDIENFANYTGGLTHYKLNVGTFFTGNYEFLTFINDHDISNPTAVSQFSNIKLYNASVLTPSLVTPPPANTLATNPPNPTLQLGVTIGQTTQNFTIESYAGVVEDVNAKVTIGDNGNQLTIEGNGWKKIGLNYNITDKTVLEFDFLSTKQGEIQAIGFDTDNIATAQTHFKLYGTENWAGDIEKFQSYRGGLQHYIINVGDFFKGQYSALTFVNDQDVSNPISLSQLSNIKLYEVVNNQPLKFTVNGIEQSKIIESYGGSSQDIDVLVSVENDRTVLLGNGWKKVSLPYTITANTTLQFDFRSTQQGEIQGIGFDTDNSLSHDRYFHLYGTQKGYGIENPNTTYNSAGQWQTFTINVGNFFTGNVNYLTLIQDDDVTRSAAASEYRNIKIFENTSPTAKVTSTSEDILLGKNITPVGLNIESVDSLIAVNTSSLDTKSQNQDNTVIKELNYYQQIIDINQLPSDSLLSASSSSLLTNEKGDELTNIITNITGLANQDNHSSFL